MVPIFSRMGKSELTDDEFNDYLKEFGEMLRSQYSDNKMVPGEFINTCIGLSYNPTTGVRESFLFKLFYEDDESKVLAYEKVGRELFKTRTIPLALFVLSEAWMAQVKPEDFNADIKPSEHHEKQEVVIMSGLKIKGEVTNCAIAPLFRTQEGTVKLYDFEYHLTDGDITFKPYLLYEVMRGYQLAYIDKAHNGNIEEFEKERSKYSDDSEA